MEYNVWNMEEEYKEEDKKYTVPVNDINARKKHRY
jgi:cytochrome c556